MKSLICAASVMLVLCSSAAMASIGPVTLYLDTAPNVYAAPAWPAFRDAAYAKVYGGTFVNQSHSNDSSNVDTLNYDVSDYMVYSFGDLGKRLHAFYYIPGETTASLADRFQVSIEYWYDGVWYNPYEEYHWGEWVTPSSWVNYDGDGNGSIDGVMGSMGNALWATDETTLAAELADAEMNLGNTRFLARLDGTVYEVIAQHQPAAVPEPTTLLVWSLLGFAAVGYGWRRRSKM